MKIKESYIPSTTYNTCKESESPYVRIKVKQALVISNNIVNPCVSIIGNDIIEPQGCVYVGVVMSASHGFEKNTRVIAVGISNCGINSEVIEAHYLVLDAVPESITDKIAVLSAYASKWINMIKVSNPPLGSIIYVEGEEAFLVKKILREIGYVITEEDNRADFKFFTEKNNNDRGNNIIPWIDGFGAGWNDQRILDGRCVLPEAYVNNSVLENIRSFWKVSSRIDYTSEKWPVEAIHTFSKDELDKSYENIHLISDKHYLEIFGDVGKDVIGRKKPITLFMLCNNGGDKKKGKEALNKVLAIVGSVPLDITSDESKLFITISFKDGSVATIQFVSNEITEYIELHFDGKSIMLDGTNAASYDCSGIDSYRECFADVEEIIKKRKEVLCFYEKL